MKSSQPIAASRTEKFRICPDLKTHKMPEDLSNPVQLKFHEIDLKIFCPSPESAKSISQYYPQLWQEQTAATTYPIYWYPPTKFWQVPDSFDEDEDAELDQFVSDSNQFGIQRDFYGMKNKNYAIFCANEKIGDGFFNAMRWLSPGLLLHHQKLLLHSSCFIDENDQAHLFMGPSGAGKTTLAAKASKHFKVLGDDINLITLRDGKAFVEAAAVGQNDLFTPKLAEQFPLKSMHFLNQSSETTIHEIGASSAIQKFLSCFIFPEWSLLTPSQSINIMNLSKKIIAAAPLNILLNQKDATVKEILDVIRR